MKSVLIRDTSTMPKTALHVLMKFIFSGESGTSNNVPGLFVPGKEYQIGDLVFTVDEDGNIHIWRALGSGASEECGPPNWEEYNLQRHLMNFQNTLEEYSGIAARIGNQVYEPHHLIYPEFKKAEDHINDLEIGDWLAPYSYYEVFIDGKLIPNTAWTLDAHSFTFTAEYLEKVPDTCDLTIRINTAVSIIARLINRIQMTVTAPDKKGVVIPYPQYVEDYDIRTEVYINGKYVPNKDYTIDIKPNEDGTTTRTISEWQGETADSYEIILNYIYSVSTDVMILQDEFDRTIIDERESFKLDLTNVGYVNKLQEIKLFHDGELIDPGRYVLMRYYAAFVKQEYYLLMNSRITAPVYTYLLPEYEEGEIRHYSQTTPAMLNGEFRFTVPFLRYDPTAHDVMIFNDSGAFLSDIKWYIDDCDIVFFEHDVALSAGDRIDFRMVNDDSTVTMQSFYFTAGVEGQHQFASTIEWSQFSMIMVFTTSGMYIPEKKVSFQGTTVVLDDSVELLLYERIQVVTFRYIYKETKTTYQRKVVNIEQDETQTIKNPFTDFSQSTDALYIFTSNGKYVGERFYEIEDDNITLHLTGDPVNFGDYVEITLIRNLGMSVDTGVKFD